MDDCDLEKLSAVPAKLSPKFNRNTTEYEATVPSSIEKVKIDCLTSDSGASYQVFGGGGEKTVLLKEGEINEIRIEVSAEDGTVKNYFIRIKRLSASDASLAQLSLSIGKIDPQFAIDCYDYSCNVPCSTQEIAVMPKAPDSKCVIVVKESDSNFVLPLLMGQTKIVVTVSSVDGTNTKDYTITVYRKQLPWPVQFKDPLLTMKYECPMTLNPIYNPVSISGSDPKVTMSQPCLDMLTRRSKVNPMSDMTLDKDWRCVDFELDKQISSCSAISVYSYKGVKDELPFSKMAEHIQKCEAKPKDEVDAKKVTESVWYKAEFESTASKAAEINHKVEVRNWEKRLQHMAGESDIHELSKTVKKKLSAYKEKLPTHSGQTVKFAEGESPVDDLLQICVCLAASVKAKSKEPKYHLQLAFALEEEHHLQELYGFSKKDENSQEVGAGTNVSALESGKLEECHAICKLRGVASNAPIALQLKAIDEEYQSLRNSGQSGKADHVQSLYVWRSKEAAKDELSGLQRLDETDPLAQAYLKYMDALVLDPNNFHCNLHVARMLLEREEGEEAVKRLHQAVGLKPTNVESRFLLGMAIFSQKSGPGDRLIEALNFLHEGLEHLLIRRQAEAEMDGHVHSCMNDFHAEDIFRPINIQVLRGLMILAENLKKKPIEGFKSSKEVYHCVCLHAAMALCEMFNRGNTYQQIEWILLEAQYKLLEIMMQESIKDTAWIIQRCRYLSAMIRSSTIPRNNKLLILQEKVSQNLAGINPCNSEFLYLLGLAQLMIFDSELNPQNHTSLDDARSSLEASIFLEGKPAAGDVPTQISSQKWWLEKVAAEKVKTQANQPKPLVNKTQTPPARGRGVASVRSKSRAATQPTRGGRGAAKPAPAPARTRGAPTGRGGKTNVPAASGNVRCDKTSETPKPAETEKSPTPAAPEARSISAPINRSSYLTRLALARAYSRTDDKKEEARPKYEEVIKMAPEVHDAYIELAELLVQTDPLAAVDVYCRFPNKANGDDGTFDDAYLSGEIVSILMKHEKYDDPRLVEHMIKWGRVMGIGVLEKYMGILDSKFKTEMLKTIYSGVHQKDVNDPDLQAFFKFKCWI